MFLRLKRSETRSHATSKQPVCFRRLKSAPGNKFLPSRFEQAMIWLVEISSKPMRPAVCSGEERRLTSRTAPKDHAVSLRSLRNYSCARVLAASPVILVEASAEWCSGLRWFLFLQDATNREELFSLLTEKVKIFSFQKMWISLLKKMFSRPAGPSDMQRCNHEEADPRIALHVLHALNKGHNQVLTPKQWTQTLLL